MDLEGLSRFCAYPFSIDICLCLEERLIVQLHLAVNITVLSLNAQSIKHKEIQRHTVGPISAYPRDVINGNDLLWKLLWYALRRATALVVAAKDRIVADL